MISKIPISLIKSLVLSSVSNKRKPKKGTRKQTGGVYFVKGWSGSKEAYDQRIRDLLNRQKGGKCNCKK